MSNINFRECLVIHQSLIRECCLASIAIRSNFKTQNLSVGQIIDGIASAVSGQLRDEKIIPFFLELGTLLSKEGWPIRMALEIIHSYPVAVWSVLGPHYLLESKPQVYTEKNRLVRVGFDSGEFQQIYQKVNSFSEWVVEAYVAQKEEYITDLYCQLTDNKINQDFQLQAAQATSYTVCNLLSQPLTVINGIASLAEEGILEQSDIKWLQKAVVQANEVLEKLRNLKHYEILPSNGLPPALDLDAASKDWEFAPRLATVDGIE